jgi:hypothetical protein
MAASTINVDFKKEVFPVEELTFGVWVISAEFGSTDPVRGMGMGG